MSVDVDAAIPSAPMSQRFRRSLSVLVGLAALSAAVLSWVEADSGRKEEQAFVNGSRGALEIFVKIAGSNPRAQFDANAARRALLVQGEGVARVIGAPKGEAFQFAVKRAHAEEKAGRRLLKVAEPMVQVSENAPRVDPATIEVIRSNTTELQAVVKEQGEFVVEANKHGTRQERGFFALGLVAIAASLLGLAGLMGDGRGGRISLVTAAGALFVAITAGASGYVF